MEHFAHHEDIELKEAQKEAEFQGISVEEALKSHEEPEQDDTHPEAAADAQHPIDPVPENLPVDEAAPEAPASAAKPKITRVTPPEKQDPSIRFQEASAQGSKQAEWGTGDQGYQSPKSPVDKMRYAIICCGVRNIPLTFLSGFLRKNLPYKVRRYHFLTLIRMDER